MKTIGNISSILGIIGFGTSYYSKYEGVMYFSLVIALVSAVVVAAIDYKNRPRKFRDANDINKFMLGWISNIGRVVIFTRDMSWAADKEIKAKLYQKAKDKELIICMPTLNALAEELISRGATVLQYSNINYEPKSRFTIVRYGRGDAKIAIGRTDNDGHLIETFNSGEHPLFSVADDLINILKKADESGIKL